MSDIIVDKYNLTYSNKFNIDGVNEVGQDLQLETAESITSSVVGKITDSDGKNLAGVTVKLFDKNGVPFKHTITGDDGTYAFVGINSDNYSISAVKKGTILTVPRNFFLQEDETKTENFQLTFEPTLSLCSIAGHIFDNDTGLAIEGALVSLIDDTTKATIATTLSANDGEYVFYDLTAKNYVIIATKDGYMVSIFTDVLAKDNTVINTDIKITKDPVKNVGTISGVVKNNNVVVQNAFVGLYSVTTVNGKDVEQLVATTKTNASGIYMFGDVVSGNYKVKAKQNALNN